MSGSGMQGKSAPFAHLTDGDQHHPTTKKNRLPPRPDRDHLLLSTGPGEQVTVHLHERPRFLTQQMATATFRGRRPSKGVLADEEIAREELEMLRKKDELRKARLEAAGGYREESVKA